MVVAKWEFRSLALMLFATHGEHAVDEARKRMEAATAAGRTGDAVVWSEVLDRLPAIIEARS